MEKDPILYTRRGPIGLLTLNRPENRNSMNAETMPAFMDILSRVRGDEALRCLVITGSGTTFCGGADFKSGFNEESGPGLRKVLMDMYAPFLAVGNLRVPVVGAMNGHAIGGGLGLALMCDIRVASADAKYGANFARLGLHSGMGISYLLPRLVGVARANELLFTGRIITGREALQMGLVNYAEEPDRVMEKAMAIAEEIAGCAPVAVQEMKASVYKGLQWSPEKTAEMESHIQARTFQMADGKEGIRAMLEKRDPVFTGK